MLNVDAHLAKKKSENRGMKESENFSRVKCEEDENESVRDVVVSTETAVSTHKVLHSFFSV